MKEGFTALKTPQSVNGDHPPPSPHAPASSLVASTLRLLVWLAMGVFIFGNIATWAPLYELQLVNTFTKWWKGYPHGDTGGGHAGHAGSIMDTGVSREIWHTGHTEMVRPTFLFLFCILPFFLGVLLIELLRFVAPARRLSSALLWKAAMVLRRKPSWPLWGVSRFTTGEWLFGLGIVVGGNVLCFWYEWDRRIDQIHAQVKAGTGVLNLQKYYNMVGISCAYLCLYNMALLLLPVTRNSVWMEFFNISYANGVKLHRWLGFATVITAVIHTGGYWGKWIINGTWRAYQLPCFHCDITVDPEGYYPWFNTFGFISVLAMLLMIPTSLPVVRRRMYEWFYISHWVLFVISFFFAILHWSQILWWILPAGLIFFVSKAASHWNGLAPVEVESFSVISSGADSADGELVKLVLRRDPLSSHDYKVGNFVYVNVPQLSKLQWHALTIASSPQTSRSLLTLLIKPVGEWSQQLVDHAKECEASQQKPVVYLDGYYGSSLELYDEHKSLLLVGGGIGVTPLLAVLEDIAAKASTAGDWVGQPHVTFVLAFRELSLLRAVAPVLLKLKELDPAGEFFESRLFCTRQPSEAALTEAAFATAATAATAPDSKTNTETVKTPRAFYEPLRASPALRLVLFVVLFIVAIFVVAAARWGNGAIQGDNHPELWPLERAFEFVVFCATIVVVYAFIWYEFTALRRSSVSHAIHTADHAAAMTLEDIHSVSDVVSSLGVVVGQRPDLKCLLEDELRDHNTRSNSAASASFLPAIATMVSGPETLKAVTNEAVVSLGRGHFDIHEEEFEL